MVAGPGRGGHSVRVWDGVPVEVYSLLVPVASSASAPQSPDSPEAMFRQTDRQNMSPLCHLECTFEKALILKRVM